MVTREYKPKIVSIVLTWNSADFIDECIRSLINSSYKTDILIIDNDSSDNTRELIYKNFPDIKVINTGKNLGYAGGNNIGIRNALENNNDYIFILNPDAVVAHNCIKKLLDRLEQEKQVAAVSPKIYFYNSNKIWFVGSNINWHSGETLQLGGEDNGQYDHIRYTQRINGCAVMLRSQQIRNVGFMDDQFFLYYEETDWSVKFTDCGLKLGIVTDAKVWHKTSASTGGYSSPLYHYYMTRNRLLFMQKHKPLNLPLAVIITLYKNIILVKNTAKNKGIHSAYVIMKAVVKGYCDFATRKFGNQRIPN